MENLEIFVLLPTLTTPAGKSTCRSTPENQDVGYEPRNDHEPNIDDNPPSKNAASQSSFMPYKMSYMLPKAVTNIH